MRRYARLYLHFLKFSLIRALAFKIDFTFRIFMDFVFCLVNILFFKIVYLHTPNLAGMNEAQMMIFVASYLFLDALVMTFIANNIWMLPSYINKGDLDYYLLRPVSSLFFLSLRDIAANSAINVLGALAILIWAFVRYPHHFYFWQITFYILFFANGLLLYYLVRMLFIIPVFKMHSSRGLDALFWGIESCMQRPVDLFKGNFKHFLTSIVPLGLIISYPVKFLFLKNIEQTWPYVIQMLTTTLIFIFILRWCWRWGLRNYSSASS